jgi:carbon monoxide dehydrogenase subunit G
MTDIFNQIRVDATPDEAWALLGDLAAAERWVPGVVSARIEDDRRVCTLADGSEIHEDITAYVPEQRRYSYAHTRHPMPLTSSTGTLRVEPDDGGSRIVWDASVEVPDPELAAMLEAGFREAIESLAAQLMRT